MRIEDSSALCPIALVSVFFSRDAKSVLCVVTWKRWLNRCFYLCKHSIRSSSIQSSKDAAAQPWTRNTITSDIKRYHAEAVCLVNFKHSLWYISLVGETVPANGRAICLAPPKLHSSHESNQDAKNLSLASMSWSSFLLRYVFDTSFIKLFYLQYNTIQ